MTERAAGLLRRAQETKQRAESAAAEARERLAVRLLSLSSRAGEAGRVRTAAACSQASLALTHHPRYDSLRSGAQLNLELSHFNIAARNLERDRLQAAAAALKRALAINQANLTEGLVTRQDPAELLHLLATTFEQTEHHARAAGYFRELLSACQARGEREAELDALNGLAYNVMKACESGHEGFGWEAAAEAFLAQFELAAELGDREALLAAAYGRGRALIESSNRSDEVVDWLQEAIALWSDPAVTPRSYASHQVVRLQNYLGRLLDDREEYARALPVLHAAAEAAKTHTGCPCRSTALNNLARALHELDDRIMRARFLREGVEHCRATGDPQEARFRSCMASALAEQGKIEAALAEAEAAIRSAEKHAPDNRTAESHLGLAFSTLGSILNNHFRRYKQAVDAFSRSVDIARDLGEDEELAQRLTFVGQALDNLGGSANLSRAVETLEQAIEVCARIDQPEFEVKARTALATTLTTQGKTDAARAQLSLVLEIHRRNGDHQGLGAALTTLAAIPGTAPERASGYLAEAAMLSSRVGNDVLGAHAMCQLARLRESLGLPSAAAEHYQRGIDIAESVRARLGNSAERAALADVTADLYANAARFAHGRGETLDAFLYAEAGRARLVLDRRAEEAAGTTADPELRERRRALAAEIGGCARELERLGVKWVKAQAAQPVDETALESEEAEALDRRLQELEAEWRTVETTLATDDARFAARAGAGIDTVWTVSTVQEELLGDQSILLEYLLVEERCLLFAITGDEFSVFEIPLEASELTRQIEELCAALEQTAASFPHGHSLYRALIEPAAELLAGKREVLICPDGALNRLPFAVLLREDPQGDDDDGNGAYFAHRWDDLPYFLQDSINIRYIASATTEGLLRRAEHAERPAYRSELLALGAPLAKIDGPAAVDFPPLPLVPVELDAIAEPFQREQTVVQPRENGAPGATRTGALQLLDGDPHGYRFVHFATHALLDGAQPWRSALVFEPDDGDRAAPGFLHANETVDLALPAECVTMSGCHTLGSEASAGEGVVGLSLAFRHAGARSVCASLWAVADRSTAELMRLFYSQQADGLAPPAALAAAQRALIAEGYHPRRWAAFGIFG